jgi:hypothetical protein
LFVNLEIPFADARPFLDGDVGRLKSPTWPLPDPEGEFVRSCGRIEIRRRGGIAPWSGEGDYCDARQAVKFPDSLGSIRFEGAEHGVGLRGVYRRYLSTGLAMSRLDVGIVPERFRYAPVAAKSAEFMRSVLHACMTVPVRTVRTQPPTYAPLIAAAPHIARHILEATTATSALDKIENWWLCAGRPMVLTEYRVDRFPHIPRPRREVAPIDDLALRLSHFYMRIKGHDVGVWLLGYRPGTDPEALRRMRVHLSRLHAEREALRKILTHIARGSLALDGSDAAERLQSYLNEACSSVTRRRWYGNEQLPILDAAYVSDALVSEGDRESLFREVERARRAIASKVRRVADTVPSQNSKLVTNIETAETVIVAPTLEGLNMEDKRVQIVGNQGTLHGVFGSDNTIQESFQNSVNRIQNAGASDELKDLLLELSGAVKTLIESVEDRTTAEQATRDLDAFTKEATSDSPRRPMLASLGAALKEAADVAEKVAAPIAKAVAAILVLF